MLERISRTRDKKVEELKQILEKTPQSILDVIKKNSSDVSDYTRKLAVRAFINGKVMLKRYDYYLGVIESKDNDFYREHEEKLIKLGIAETYGTKFYIPLFPFFCRSTKTWLRIKEKPKVKEELRLKIGGEPAPKQYIAYWSQN